ncbi:MAG: hypothetical protein ACJAYB_002536 [Psychromonas sp.]|jgi:hypothetical protein
MIDVETFILLKRSLTIYLTSIQDNKSARLFNIKQRLLGVISMT